jgi:integrase
LIEAGFLKWLESQAGEGRVFLFLKGSRKSDPLAVVPSEDEWLEDTIASLHSFRHTLTVKLELAKTHGSLMRRLLGHSLGNDGVYLRSLTYEEGVTDCIGSVKFPTIS